MRRRALAAGVQRVELHHTKSYAGYAALLPPSQTCGRLEMGRKGGGG